MLLSVLLMFSLHLIFFLFVNILFRLRFYTLSGVYFNIFSVEAKVVCPYNNSHHIHKNRIEMHILKCRNQHKGPTEMVVCDFNASHVIPKIELQVKICIKTFPLNLCFVVTKPLLISTIITNARIEKV